MVFKGRIPWDIGKTRKNWRPFEEARVFARSLQLKGWVERYQYRKSGERPNDIPANPEKIYKNDGWKGMIDWLGNEGRIREPISEETKRKMSTWVRTEETKRKMSEAQMGRRNQEFNNLQLEGKP